jgi:hypothetical protein
VESSLFLGAMLLGATTLGAQQPGGGRVEGVASAAIGTRPPRDVLITLTRLEPEPVTTRTTTADSLGRWHVDSLAPGRYLLEVSSALLDSLQLAIGAREIRIAGADTVRADIALPSEAAVRTALLEAEQTPRVEGGVDTTTGALLLTGTASVAGRVPGPTNEPVAGVQLSVRDARGTATSDSGGRFLLTGLPAGAQVLVARRLGYALTERVVELRAGQRTTVDVRIERMAALDSMRVTALGGRYREFEFNRGANIFGRYLTRDQILRRRPADNADLLYHLGGFTVIGHGGAAAVYSKREMRKPDPCPANVVIDGVQGRRINDVRPLRIVGLEAYEGPSTFTSDYEAKCGLIVIWTSAWRAPGS